MPASRGVAQAGASGFGVSLRPNETTIYVPVRIHPSWLLECELGLREGRTDGQSSLETAQSPIQGRHKDRQVGLGLYWLRPLGDNVRLCAGPRVASLRDTSMYSGGELFIQGMDVAPTLGVEDFPVRWLSIGSEVGCGFQRMRSTQLGTQAPARADFTCRGEGTRPALILRVYL